MPSELQEVKWVLRDSHQKIIVCYMVVTAILMWSNFPKPKTHLLCCYIGRNKDSNHSMDISFQ